MKHYHNDYSMHLSRRKQDVAGLLCTSDLKTYFSFGDSIQFLKVEKITTESDYYILYFFIFHKYSCFLYNSINSIFFFFDQNVIFLYQLNTRYYYDTSIQQEGLKSIWYNLSSGNTKSQCCVAHCMHYRPIYLARI